MAIHSDSTFTAT